MLIDTSVHPILADKELFPLIGKPWSDGRLPAKVRAAVTRKIPLIVVIGRREVEERSVTVRDRSGQERPMPRIPGGESGMRQRGEHEHRPDDADAH